MTDEYNTLDDDLDIVDAQQAGEEIDTTSVFDDSEEQRNLTLSNALFDITFKTTTLGEREIAVHKDNGTGRNDYAVDNIVHGLLSQLILQASHRLSEIMRSIFTDEELINFRTTRVSSKFNKDGSLKEEYAKKLTERSVATLECQFAEANTYYAAARNLGKEFAPYAKSQMQFAYVGEKGARDTHNEYRTGAIEKPIEALHYRLRLSASVVNAINRKNNSYLIGQQRTAMEKFDLAAELEAL